MLLIKWIIVKGECEINIFHFYGGKTLFSFRSFLVVTLYFIFLLLFLFVIVVQVQLFPFPPPTALPCPTNPHLPLSILPPFGLSVSPLYMVLDDPSPAFPCPPLPSGSCQFVLYFNVSGSILLVYLFCWLGSTKSSFLFKKHLSRFSLICGI